ncbi:MAG: VWA domain-containing protein, partial [Deltaproteobacteria bacterium]|nr:VWA domain-containing protein [Deltaproteobacteria bacterium]
MVEAASLAQKGIPIHVTPISPSTRSELSLRHISVPDRIRAGNLFDAKVGVWSNTKAKIRLHLDLSPKIAPAPPPIETELTPGPSEYTFRMHSTHAGEAQLRARLEPLEPSSDTISENNEVLTSLQIEDRPKALLAAFEPSRLEDFAHLIKAAGFEVELRPLRNLPTESSGFSPFDLIVLSDASSADISPATERALIHALGRGALIWLSAGPRSHGPLGWKGSGLEPLLPLSPSGRRMMDRPSRALALVIDRSGSMAGPKMELAKEAARAAAEALGSSDELLVIGFDTVPERIVPLQSASNRVGILRDIGRLAPRGGTAILPALQAAYQDLLRSRAPIRHTVLLTDGQSQEQGIPELVSAMRADGITLTAVGVGADVNRHMLAEIADRGGGRLYFTADPSNLPRIFLREALSQSQSDWIEGRFRIESTRTLPQEFATPPPLKGYVLTELRQSASILLRSERGDPILAERKWNQG